MSVLRRQTGHLLLIRINLGCGTVLTAACGRRGCSAIDFYYLLCKTQVMKRCEFNSNYLASSQRVD
jgi:hypothetical protein